MNALLRILAWLLAVALVALPVVAVLNGWVGAGHWPLSRLRANGQFERVPAEQLQQALAPHAARGFFAVDLDAAQGAVEQLPWVEQAQVLCGRDAAPAAAADHDPLAPGFRQQRIGLHLDQERQRAGRRGDACRCPECRAGGEELSSVEGHVSVSIR